MIDRYIRPEMGNIWNEESKFYYWLRIELAILKARREIGEMDVEIPEDLFKRIEIDPQEINRIEREITRHDVIAFLSHVSPQLPENLRPWFHRGVTSYDPGDTALALQMVESLEILKVDLYHLMATIKELAYKYKYTPEIGRTHGIHAEPITFGVKLANWYSELARRYEDLVLLTKKVAVGKVSGAVGMYTLDPKIEGIVCRELGLRPVVATQIIARDVVSDYMSSLGNLAAVISKIALNIRLLSQTDVCEVMEPFGKNQKGSSAMPHKQNPIKSEQICGIARTICANVIISFETQANCWFERSLDNSSSERIIIPDSSQGLDYIIHSLTEVMKGLRVFPEKMLANMDRTYGLIFSQEVMMLVAGSSGLPREEAHTLVRDIAVKCAETGESFFEAIKSDSKIMSTLTLEELHRCFNLEEKLKNVDSIFARVFVE